MKIKYLNNDLPDRVFTETEITVGREEDNVLQLLSEGISRYHGKIYCKNGQWFIEDLGSTNGIKHNGKKISAPEKLQEDDIIDFYQEQLQISNLYPEQETVLITSTDTAAISITDIITENSNIASADPLIIAPAVPETDEPGAISLSPLPQEDINGNSDDKKSELDELSQFIKQNTGNLFNKSNKNNSENKKVTAPQNNTGKKKFGNKLFYVILVCSVIVIGAFVIKIMEDKNKPVKSGKNIAKEQETPLYLNYIKENTSANNVFRFNLTIENKKATFIVDDLRSKLSYGPIVKAISDSELEKLKQTIKDSNFMSTPKVQPGIVNNQEIEYKELEIYYGKSSNTIIIKNRPTPREFMDIEDALTLFAESCNLVTISLSPEVLQEQAENSFKIASDKLANYETNLAYLKEAIDGFNITIEYLAGISPEPQIRKVAAEQLKRATTIRDRWIKQFRSQYSTMINQRDWEGAHTSLQHLISLYDESSKEYQVAKQRLIRLDILRRQIKKRK